MTHPTVTIQISPESQPSTPIFLGEVAVFAQVLTQTGILKAIQDQMRFARARFGKSDLIDFVAVLIGYVLSGEPTLLAFYERLAPWASPFMAQIAARPATPSLNPVPVSGGSRPTYGGSSAHRLSRGCACAQPLFFRL